MYKAILISIHLFVAVSSCNDEKLGCIDSDACNYDASAKVDDGSCIFAKTWYADQDNDGMGNPKDSVVACAQPENYVDNANDLGLAAGPSSQRHTKWAIGSKYANQGFWEYLPAGYGTGDKWPLIIFFHGLGENGDGNEAALEKLLQHGPPNLIDQALWPVASGATADAFIVLSVQNARGGCHTPSDIDAFIRWAADTYDVDVTRVYLTGLSCGAIGVWNYLKDHLTDDLVAAVVPIAGLGRGTWQTHQCGLGVMPIWAIHGDNDQVVSVNGTNIPMDALSNCSDPEPLDAKKTIYPGVGHNSWTRSYDLSAGHDIYTWMLSHTNPNAGF